MPNGQQSGTPAPVAPVPGSPEYDAAMIAEAGGTPAPAGTPTPAPTDTLIDGKFKSQDDLLKAYKELEKKLGGKPADTPTPTPDAASLKMAPEVQDILTKAGLSEAALTDEYTKDGKLSDDTYAKLGAVGVPKSMVDAYVAGQAAAGAKFVSDVHALAGGPEAFGALTKWAQTNASPDDLKAYNAAIDSGDMGRIRLAVSAFNGAYKNANPSLVGGTVAPLATGYRSQAEMNAAIQDPRYRKDEAYRADVYAKIALTK
jgi:hypothetical protein